MKPIEKILVPVVLGHAHHGWVADAAVLDGARRSSSGGVMGTHGRTSIKRVLLGSVAENVARTASCPVLIVRAEG